MTRTDGWPTPWWRAWLGHWLMLPKWALALGLIGLTLVLQPAWWPVLLLVGFLAWFPIEYVLHRFIFHFFAEHPRFGFAAQQHWEHHLDPDRPAKVFVDPWRMIAYSILLALVYLGLTRELAATAALMGGTYAGLVYYEYMHLLTHAPGTRPKLPWTKAMKKWHLLHHYKHEDHWFGVTNRVLDRAWGTATDPDTVEKSDTVRTLGVPEAVSRWMQEEQDG